MTNDDIDNLITAYFSSSPLKTYQKSEVVIQGDLPSTHTYFVVKGYIKGYTINNEGVYSLSVIKGPGDIFPLASIFSSENSSIYYEALTDIEVRSVRDDVLEAALETQAELASAIFNKTLEALRDYVSRLDNLEIMDSQDRVKYRLLYLLKRFGATNENGKATLKVPLSYPDLADSLNITRDTVNRIVRQLVKEGLVEKSRNRLKLVNSKALEEQVSRF